jgi:hypothetical protein
MGRHAVGLDYRAPVHDRLADLLFAASEGYRAVKPRYVLIGETREEVYEDAIRHALKRLEAGTVEECKVFLRECIKRFPDRSVPRGRDGE